MPKYDVGQYLYNHLPALYQKEDITTDYTLKRFLDTVGLIMSETLDETVNLLDLIDVEKTPTHLLPYYARMFGFEYDTSVPEDFQRKYLANIVDIQKRKGTKEVLEFTARELTGMNATVIEGQALTFKTWSPYNNTGAITNRNPKTYNKRNGVNYYYLGGETCDRFTVTVILTTEGHIDSEQLFLNTQLISRFTKDLVQPYIKLRYKAYGMAYSDVYTKDIVEEENIKIRDVDLIKPKVTEGDISLNSKESYSEVHTSKIVTKYSNKVTLEPNSESRINRVSESNHSDKVVEIHNINVTVNVSSGDNSNVDLTPTEDIITSRLTQEQKVDSLHLNIDEETVQSLANEVQSVEYIHLKETGETIQLQNKQEEILDYIHLDITNDIINLSGKVTDSFEDITRTE